MPPSERAYPVESKMPPLLATHQESSLALLPLMVAVVGSTLHAPEAGPAFTVNVSA